MGRLHGQGRNPRGNAQLANQRAPDPVHRGIGAAGDDPEARRRGATTRDSLYKGRVVQTAVKIDVQGQVRTFTIFLADHNARFVWEPAEPHVYHRRTPSARALEQVFCLETERSISNDWVVRYENRYFQLERHSDYPLRQAKVRVCEWEDGRIEIHYQGKAQAHREIAMSEPKPPASIRMEGTGYERKKGTDLTR
jgi:hypothetical protein